jgi:hypothetical protein
MYIKAFHDHQVVITPDLRLKSIKPNGNGIQADFQSDYGDHPYHMKADHMVIEHGTLPNDALYHDLMSSSHNNGITDIRALLAGEEQPLPSQHEDGFSLFRVGDAVASRNIHAAILDARRLCQTI